MRDNNTYPHRFRLDKTIRLATDNVMGYMVEPEYNPTPPPILGYFLLLDNTNFLLLNGQNLTLL